MNNRLTYSIVLLTLYFGMTFSTVIVQAKNNQVENSNISGVSFYGEYVFPDEKGIESNSNNKENQNIKVSENEISNIEENNTNDKLPKTGNQKSSLHFIGIFLLGFWLFIKQNKISEEKNEI